MPLSIGEKIKVILNRKNVTITELAERTGQTRQNLTNKFARDNFTEKEAREIAKVLDCDFDTVFTLKNTGEIL